MRSSGNKVSLIVDEFGGISGLITLTSLIEKIVGSTGEEGIRPKEKYIIIEDYGNEKKINDVCDQRMNCPQVHSSMPGNTPQCL